MSYWVYLRDGGEDGETVTIDHHEGDGGTYQIGGSTLAELNVTYNYGEVYSVLERANPDLGLHFVKDLDGKVARDVIPALEWAVGCLGDNPYRTLDGNRVVTNYWAPTPGNAGRVLSVLLSWSRQHPNATFVVH